MWEGTKTIPIEGYIDKMEEYHFYILCEENGLYINLVYLGLVCLTQALFWGDVGLK